MAWGGLCTASCQSFSTLPSTGGHQLRSQHPDFRKAWQTHCIPHDFDPSPSHQGLFCLSGCFQCKTFLTLAWECGRTSVAKLLSVETLMMWKLIVPASTCLVQTWDCCSAITADVRPWKGATWPSFIGMHEKEGQMLQIGCKDPILHKTRSSCTESAWRKL